MRTEKLYLIQLVLVTLWRNYKFKTFKYEHNKQNYRKTLSHKCKANVKNMFKKNVTINSEVATTEVN